MVTTVEGRREIIEQFRINENDTGSADVQIALLTDRIRYMTEHMKAEPSDFHSRYGLIAMVNRRNRLLKYLRREEPERYRSLIGRLGLRK
jgi:small subunit ribosomal protein S15